LHLRKFFIALLLIGLSMAASAQWLHYPAPGTPRARDGKPNLSAPAPKVKGKPDLNGVWQIEPTPLPELTRLFGDVTTFDVPGDDSGSFSKYLFNILADYAPGDEPVRPEAAAIRKQRGSGDLPTTMCLPGGVPFSETLPFPFKIIQNLGITVVLYEGDSTVRQIYTDGRKHTPDPQPTWMGYSVGRWDADTLVVDTVGFNDKTWLDVVGHPHSDALHTVERMHRRDFGHLDIEITFDDPKMYTRPFTVKFTSALVPDSDIQETVCAENEKDRLHFR
jgi:hypothetical protein